MMCRFALYVVLLIPLLVRGEALVSEKNIEVGDHKLFVRTTTISPNGPTVVFESGGGGSSREWDLVQKLLASKINTLAYDRAGLGKSERGPEPRTMRQEAFELHSLLENEGITKKPHILVGQSMGGLLARIYTQRYGSNVVGLVLVDPTHESAVLGSLRYGGWTRIREKAQGAEIPEARLLREPVPKVASEVDYFAEELSQLHQNREAEAARLKNIPLVVLGAGVRKAPPGTGEDKWKVLREERDAQVRDLTNLSQNAYLILAPTNTHQIHTENPALVAEAIEWVIKRVGEGAAGREATRPPRRQQ
jgi:pimeloyl-ACP methyl ester carboxylesterase